MLISPERVPSSRAAPAQEIAAAGAAVLAAVGVGELVVLESSWSLVLLLLGGVAVVLSLVDLEIGLAVFVFLTYTRLSDVAVQFHGAPSVLQPFAVLLLLSAVVRRRSQVAASPAVRLAVPVLLAWFAAQALSLLFAPDPAATRGALLAFGKNVLVVLLAVTLMRTRRALSLVVSALLGAGLLLSLISAYQYFSGASSSNFGGLGQGSVLNIAASQEGFRVGGPIGDANYYAQVLLVLVPLGLYRTRCASSLPRRILAGFTTAVVLLAVLLTFSRGGLVAAAVVAVLVVLHSRRRLVCLGLVALAILIAVPYLPRGYVTRVSGLGQLTTSSQGADTSLQNRARTLRAGGKMLADHPVLGVGLANYSLLEPSYAGSASFFTPREGTPPHDIFLEVGAETGAVGLVVFGGLLATVFRSLRRTRHHAPGREDPQLTELMWALQVSVLAYLSASVFIHAAYPRYMWLLFGICWAVINLSVGPAAGTDHELEV